MPLPHPRTLQKLISGQRSNFGINQTSLSAIQRNLGECKPRDRQGVLIFDEMKLREGIEFNKQTSRLNGYVDFGDILDDVGASNPTMADHALVVMYRPLYDFWVGWLFTG